MVIECGRQLICRMRLAIRIVTIKAKSLDDHEIDGQESTARFRDTGIYRDIPGDPFSSVIVVVSSFTVSLVSHRPIVIWPQGTGARHIEVQIMGDLGKVQSYGIP